MPQLFDNGIDDEPVFERSDSFGGGQDAFTRATLLPGDTNQKLVNVLVKDKLEAGTRPGTHALGTARAAAIMGLAYYDTPATEQLIAANSGTLENWNGSAWAAMSGYTFDPAVRPAFAQGVDKLLITDAANNLVTWNGTAFTDEGSGATSPPVTAGILLFHAGRMFAAGFPGGTAGKENDAVWGSDLLNFQAGGWNGTTQQFRVGGGDGDPIKALASLQQFQMAVLKENSVWLVNTNPELPFSQYSAALVTQGVGCVGRDAQVVLGNDLFFMARDGVRSLQRMQAAAGQWQVTPPMSLPVQNVIDTVNWSAADKILATKHNEFVFFFLPVNTDTYPTKAIVFNARLGRWLGEWTGWAARVAVVTRFGGTNRLVFGDASGWVQQWKDYASESSDSTYQDLANTGAAVSYPTKLWTRGLMFGDPVSPKDLFDSQVRFSAGSATVKITANLDNSDRYNWNKVLKPTGSIIGVSPLPWTLGSSKPVLDQKGLRSNAQFNECFFKIESPTGWWKARNYTVAAFINPMQGN